MHIVLLTFGNSRGVLLPKSMLAQVGLAGKTVADLSVQDGSIVIKPLASPRAGWEEAAKNIALHADDTLRMGEFANADDADDADLAW
ncbi:AbrB/MazE/SpoVT family DNA-binding domain-containing protein [Rhodoferax antarcticus]|uniref:AbrB/MazE/SpoVT family DNA-binding domain-containing protein n=1 Tax=Rhodoferax antarcticus TaxID=81479 RepID=UPI0022254388|nr:AbrB/MazE/SpoVT family DNA-binding domain-containing protein [Rhodoferax antarcticus]MCW2314139.1 antitoxin MazE [Rhodoferax antarcticus]